MEAKKAPPALCAARTGTNFVTRTRLTESDITQDSAKLRAGFDSGGGKGAIARSGGAAEGSAPQMFAGMSREEVAYGTAQEKAVVIEA